MTFERLESVSMDPMGSLPYQHSVLKVLAPSYLPRTGFKPHQVGTLASDSATGVALTVEYFPMMGIEATTGNCGASTMLSTRFPSIFMLIFDRNVLFLGEMPGQGGLFVMGERHQVAAS